MNGSKWGHNVRVFCGGEGALAEAEAVRPRRAGSDDTEEPVESNQVVSVLSQARGPGPGVQTPLPTNTTAVAGPALLTVLIQLKDPPEPPG